MVRQSRRCLKSWSLVRLIVLFTADIAPLWSRNPEIDVTLCGWSMLAFESSCGLRAQFVKIGDDTLRAITKMMREITDSKWKWDFFGCVGW